MKRFAVIGVGGYVAPRHLKAIQETNNICVAALDKHDSVGVIDSFFPETQFFTEFERFDRHIDKLRRLNEAVDYLSVCSPNYLHDAHIRFGLRSGMDVICEKPIVLNPWNLDAIEQIESETGRQTNCILQLRLHPAVLELKNHVNAHPDKRWDVKLRYITSRGNWYHHSWKGDETKSGGVMTNIGIHFFDMLMFIFGPAQLSSLIHIDAQSASGELELPNADVRWELSVNADHLPEAVKERGERTYRSLLIGENEFEFSKGFTDLHTLSYKEILSGNGFAVAETRPSLELVHRLRTSGSKGIRA